MSVKAGDGADDLAETTLRVTSLQNRICLLEEILENLLSPIEARVATRPEWRGVLARLSAIENGVKDTPTDTGSTSESTCEEEGITPEMIDAGKQAHLDCCAEIGTNDQIVEEIYRAMRAAKWT